MSAGDPMRNERDEPRLTTADLAAAADRTAARVEQQRRGDQEVERGPVAEPQPADVQAGAQPAPLFPEELVSQLHARWNDIQAGFVDEPRRAVEEADGLVAETIKRLADSFANERGRLESQWDRGGDVSTEELRQALQRYRSFFTRLLSV
ncbi:MAG TPA: hypothetical protein VFS05_13300 [Gemmatimonadaceae bacterium]|nr:hypothetical protein [Gemmatimonadaceae bacterium]